MSQIKGKKGKKLKKQASVSDAKAEAADAVQRKNSAKIEDKQQQTLQVPSTPDPAESNDDVKNIALKASRDIQPSTRKRTASFSIGSARKPSDAHEKKPNNDLGDLVFDTEGGSKDQIHAGSEESLIAALYNPNIAESFIAPFILCMHSFTSPQKVLQTLIAKHKSNAHRVQRVLEIWVSSHWSDFRNDAELRETLLDFTSKLTSEYDPDKRLNAWIEKMQRTDAGLASSAAKHRATMVHPPTPLMVEAALGWLPSALDLHPVEIARQLTLIDEELYKAVEAREAVDQAWTKNNGKNAPNLLRLIERFNHVSEWVSSEILACDGRRSLMLGLFIEVADALRQMNNFQSTMAVLGGLGASAVTRLKRNWSEITAKQQETFDDLSKLMSLTSNMKNLSDHLQTVTPPAIPYVGLYLGHLTFIDEGNPNKVGELFNFTKRRQVTATVFQLIRFQILSYDFEALPALRKRIDNYARIPEEDQYRISLLVQGRKSEALKIPSKKWHQAKLFPEYADSRDRSQFYDNRLPPFVLQDSQNKTHVASLAGFVALLTAPTVDDFGGALRQAFLLLYRSVTNTRVVLLLLQARYEAPVARNQKQAKDLLSSFTTPMRQLIGGLLRFWIGKYWDTFFADGADEIAAACHQLLSMMNEPYMANFVTPLKALLDSKFKQYKELEHARVERGCAEEAPSNEDIVGCLATVTDAGVDNVALTLAIVSWQRFAGIDYGALYTYVLEHLGDSGSTTASQFGLFAHLMRDERSAVRRTPDCFHPYIRHYFATTRWVEATVLNGDTGEKRANLIGFFASVAERSLALQNFNGLAAILSGLSSRSIAPSVLPHAWSLVSDDVVLRLKELASLVSSTADYQAYRAQLRQLRPPGVPLVVPLLEDIASGIRKALQDTAMSLSDAKVASAVPNQLSKLLPDCTVSPPGRLERNAVLHVNSWVTVATSISDFAPWLQSPYEAECDLELMKSLNTALKINDNAETIAARSVELQTIEGAAAPPLPPQEKELEGVCQALFESSSTSGALVSSLASVSREAQRRHLDSLQHAWRRTDDRQRTLLSTMDRRLHVARQRIAELKAAWDAPTTTGDLLSLLFPEADVQSVTKDDESGSIYGWPQSVTLPVINLVSNVTEVAGGGIGELLVAHNDEPAADDASQRRLVSVCARVARLPHVSVALRVGKLFGASPLLVATECVDDARDAAGENGVMLIVV